MKKFVTITGEENAVNTAIANIIDVEGVETITTSPSAKHLYTNELVTDILSNHNINDKNRLSRELDFTSKVLGNLEKVIEDNMVGDDTKFPTAGDVILDLLCSTTSNGLDLNSTLVKRTQDSNMVIPDVIGVGQGVNWYCIPCLWDPAMGTIYDENSDLSDKDQIGLIPGIMI